MESSKPRNARRNLFHPNLRAPDWSAWQGIQSAELWEAVALSCEIDPSCVAGWIEPRPNAATEKIVEFQNRLRRAVAGLEINDGQLPSTYGADKLTASRVNLGDFRAWASAGGWELPPAFPYFIAKRVSGESPEERKRRIERRVDDLTQDGKMSRTAAFKRVALTEISKTTGREGIGWATVKQIYQRPKPKIAATPATPATPAKR